MVRRALLVVGLLLPGCAAESSGDTGGSVSAPAVCDDFCQRRLSCDEGADPDDDEMVEACRTGCAQSFALAASVDKSVCPMMLEPVFACVGALPTCAEYEAWFEEVSPYPCEDEETNYRLNCE